MWRRRRSALFIDFENISLKVSPQMVDALVAWLEDGSFDAPGGKRNLVHKRIYWNSSAEKHRETFEAAGFDVVLCEKFATMKNGADIRMALDVVDIVLEGVEVEEYILFSTDSDFVPVLQRLTEKAKTSAILVDEARMDAAHGVQDLCRHPDPDAAANEALGLQAAEEEHPAAQPGGRRSAGLNHGAQPASLKTTPAPTPKPDKSLDAGEDEPIAQAERAGGEARQPHAEEACRAQGDRGAAAARSTASRRLAPGLSRQTPLPGPDGRDRKRDKRVKVKPGRNHSASVMYVPADEPPADGPNAG